MKGEPKKEKSKMRTTHSLLWKKIQKRKYNTNNFTSTNLSNYK